MLRRVSSPLWIPRNTYATRKKRKIPPEPCERGGERRVRQDRPKRRTDLERKKDNDSMEECVVCKKYYLKGRGLKIHQKKAGCFSKLQDLHRNFYKSEAAVTQVTNHSDNSSLVNLLKVETTSKTTTGGKYKAEADTET